MNYLLLALVSQLAAHKLRGYALPNNYYPTGQVATTTTTNTQNVYPIPYDYVTPEPLPNGYTIPYAYKTPAPYPVPQPTTTTAPYYPPAQSSAPYYPPAQSSAPYYPPAQSSQNNYPPAQSSVPYYPPPQSSQNNYPPAQSSAPYYPPAESSAPYYPPAQSSQNNYPPAQSSAPYYPPAQTSSQVTPIPSSSYPPSNSTTPSGDKVVVGYYVPWGKVEPEAINYKSLTHINYGFGVLYQKNQPANITIDQYYDGTRIKKIQKLAADNGVKSLISIGGWTGSQTFSTVAKDSGLTDQFIQNALEFVRPSGYNLDGIDIDWEYPACQGSDNNAKDPNDSANYLTLLKKLRAALDKEFGSGKKLITAAVRVEPFFDPSCKPMTDVKEYGNYFDFINIMAYDIMGPWSDSTGPNAPFEADPKNKNTYSFSQSIKSWLGSGFPANKLVGGLAFYGHSVTSTVDMNASPDNIYVSKDSKTPKGDQFDTCEANAINNEGASCSGVWKYSSIRNEIVDNNGSCKNGWSYHWDQGTQTPWVFNQQSKVFISYDDVKSIGVKVDYAKKQNIRGVMIWEMSMDYNNELLNAANAIRS